MVEFALPVSFVLAGPVAVLKATYLNILLFPLSILLEIILKVIN